MDGGLYLPDGEVGNRWMDACRGGGGTGRAIFICLCKSDSYPGSDSRGCTWGVILKLSGS